MNIAISNIAWDIENDEKISNLMNSYGKIGLEIAPTKYISDIESVDDVKIDKIVNYWKAKKIKLVASQSILYGKPDLQIFASENSRQKTLSYLKKAIILLSKLHIPTLVFGSPKNRNTFGKPKKIVDDIAVNFFSEIAHFAMSKNIFFCIEPNPKDYQCNFVTNTSEAVTLIKKVGHPNFNLNLDSGIITLNKEQPEKAINHAFQYLKHFHISEPFLKPISDGYINHSVFANELYKLHYKKTASIEMLTGKLENSYEKIKKSLQKVVNIYKSVN